MQPNDKPQFLAVLNGLAAIKPGAKITTEGLNLWWSAFENWTIEEFREAAAHLAKSSEFMPNPYHFEQLRKAGRMTSGEAWAKVLEYVRGGGYHQWDCGLPTWNKDHPQLTDPLILAAVRAIGGFDAIAMSKTDQTPFLERRFAEHYDAISDVEDVRESVPRIANFTRALPYDDKRRLT
jgi:hypothetical protein